MWTEAGERAGSKAGDRFRLTLLAFAYHLFAWLCLRLTPAKFAGAIGPDLGDPLFNLAILRWVADRARHGFADLWNPTFFYPTPGALALSDHLIGPGTLVAALDAFGLSPLATYNALILMAFGASAFAAHWVLEQSGLSRFASAIAALLWSFSGIRWSELSHVQTLLAPFVPLVLWSFHRLLDRPDRKRAIAFCSLYLANLLGGAYLAYMTHLPLGVIAALRLARRNRIEWDGRARRTLALSALFVVCSLGLVFGPYLRVGKAMGLRPKLSELSGLLVTTKSLISVGPRALYADLVPAELQSGRGFWPGFVLAGFGAVGFCRYLFAGSRDRRRVLTVILLLALALFALLVSDWRFVTHGLVGAEAQRAARPVFRASIAAVLLALFLIARITRPSSEARRETPPDAWWHALLVSGVACLLAAHVAFFAILRGHVPGLESVRDPGRFLIFASFSGAAFAARAIDELRSGLQRSARRLFEIGILIAAAVECVPRPVYLEWRSLAGPRDLPAEYAWVQSEPAVRAIVEFPLGTTWREAERMYFWSIHRRPIVNGYSGYLPERYVELVRTVGAFPDREAARSLGELGVTHVIVHLEELTRAGRKRWSRWRSKLDRSNRPWLLRVRDFGSAEIYEIIPAAEGRSREARSRRRG